MPTKRDQIAIAALTFAALASMGVWWVSRGGPSHLVNIEQAAPLDYRFLVDVNTAEWPELAQLPDVGEVLSRRIVEHRQTAGRFETPEDLLAVPGIGDKTLAKIRRYFLTLPGEKTAASKDLTTAAETKPES